MRTLILAVILTLTASPALCEEKEKSNKRKASLINKLPPLKTGFLVDLDPGSRDGFFYFGLEAASMEVFDQRWSIDAGVASGRVLAGFNLGIWFNGAVGPFIWGGYNIRDNAPAWGIGLNMLKL